MILYLITKSNLILRDKVIELFVAFRIWTKDSSMFTMWAKTSSSCLKFWLYWDSNKKFRSSDKLFSLKKTKTDVVSSDERFIDFLSLNDASSVRMKTSFAVNIDHQILSAFDNHSLMMQIQYYALWINYIHFNKHFDI